MHTCYNIKVTENWVITGLYYTVTTGMNVLEVKYISVSKRRGICWQEQLLNISAFTRGKGKLDLCSCVSLIGCLPQKWSLCRKRFGLLQRKLCPVISAQFFRKFSWLNTGWIRLNWEEYIVSWRSRHSAGKWDL